MKTYKRIIALMLVVIVSLSSLSSAFAEINSEDELWTGWFSMESGAEGARSAASDGGHAFGIAQFDDRWDLIEFLRTCINEDATKYGAFQKIVDKYVSSSEDNCVSSNAEDLNYMITAWHNAYDADPEGFTELQLSQFVADYYAPIKQQCLDKGIDLSDEKYSPVLRGTLWSICIWAGANGASKVVNKLNADMTETEMLDICYSSYTAELKGADSKYINGFRNRWQTDQKQMAVSGYTAWSNGQDLPTTLSGDLSTMLAGAGVQYTYDGSAYIDFVKEWVDKYPTLVEPFKTSGGWNTENKEWCKILRTAGDFFELYGIIGGEVDFTGGTSGGMLIGDVAINAESLSVPDNGGSNPVVYFQQNGGQGWSDVRFGGGSIASSGCSVTSLGMALSFLKGGTDSDNWIYPSDVVKKIQEKTGNYNHFYVGNAGQSWDIFPSVASYYGVNCTEISTSSIINTLSNGGVVIMSCKPGEFTKGGHFICLTGLTDDGYVVLNDPSHPDKAYNKYTVSYLTTQGKGWWAFTN